MNVDIQETAGQASTVGQCHIDSHIVPPGIHTAFRKFISKDIGDLLVNRQFALVEKQTDGSGRKGFCHGIGILTGVGLGTDKCFNLTIIHDL